MKTGVELIAQERKEQIEKHGFDVHMDAGYYQQNELVEAAMYTLTTKPEYYPKSWPSWFSDKLIAKIKRLSPQEFRIESLKIAGALIAAEIDRLQTTEP